MNPRLKTFYDWAPVPLQNVLVSAFSIHLDRQRYGGRFKEFRALLERSEYATDDEMVAYQDAQLRKIVRHAYETVPYYREIFDSRGLHPDDIRGQQDLLQLPLLTKEIIKERFDDLWSRAFRRRSLYDGHTSGTTGQPLEVLYDRAMVAMNYAALDRQYLWAGSRMAKGGDRVAVIRGNVIVPLDQKTPPFWRTNYVHRQLLLSNFHMSEANLPAYFDALRHFKPRVLDGYPSSVYVLAKVLLNRGQRLPLVAVLTSSETLFDFQRTAIETAFECKVYDYYGHAERVVFAAECERHEGHHLFSEYGITEILDANGARLPPGTEGMMVGTSLQNYGMPLVRYVTNDRTAIKSRRCGCGRPLPLMEDVTTKAEDLLRLKDGRYISPSVLTHPFKPLNAIDGSQIVQKAMDHLVVRIVPRADYSQNDSDQLVRDLKARLGQDMIVDLEFVNELPRTKAGKFKWVISEVELGI